MELQTKVSQSTQTLNYKVVTNREFTADISMLQSDRKITIFPLTRYNFFKHTHFNVRLQVKRMAALADRWILTQLVVAAAVYHHSSPLISVMGLHLSTMF